MDPLFVGLALAGLSVLLAGWLAYQIVLQNGRLLWRIERLEQQLGVTPGAAGAPTDGLPLGSVVFDFDLPELSGGRMRLSQWRGQQALLIFFDPRCPFCRQMLPDLAALPAASDDGRPVPLIISTGEVAENRRLFAAHGVRCPVLLQEEMEVADLLRIDGTPMGYLVDERGRTASTLTIGAPALLALAAPARTSEAAPGRAVASADTTRAGGLQFTRSVTTSRLKRDGLRPGEPAPAFRLPRLEGGELSLEEYRGRRVLLVFSDPDCGPCDELAPDLEQVHRRSTDLQVLMVSRGSLEANCDKAVHYGLTFPIALQRHWEISREYAMFATPIGYLIDEKGVIAADVAVGVQAVLGLVPGPAAPGDGNGQPLFQPSVAAGKEVTREQR